MKRTRQWLRQARPVIQPICPSATARRRANTTKFIAVYAGLTDATGQSLPQSGNRYRPQSIAQGKGLRAVVKNDAELELHACDAGEPLETAQAPSRSGAGDGFRIATAQHGFYPCDLEYANVNYEIRPRANWNCFSQIMEFRRKQASEAGCQACYRSGPEKNQAMAATIHSFTQLGAGQVRPQAPCPRLCLAPRAHSP